MNKNEQIFAVIAAVFVISVAIIDPMISVAIAVILIVLFVLVKWHAKTYSYRCEECGHEFSISALRDFISPHGIGTGGGWKYLKCPKCRKRARMKEVRK